MFTGRELDATFDVGYRCGQIDGRNHGSDRGGEVVDLDLEVLRQAQQADPERFHRLAEAVREGGDAIRELAREWGGDDLLDVAEAAGATPLAEDVDSGQVVIEIEQWLREQGR